MVTAFHHGFVAFSAGSNGSLAMTVDNCEASGHVWAMVSAR